MKAKDKHSLVACLALTVYIGLQLAALVFHEPWPDELQAWLIARDASPLDILFRIERYEATPGLWHLLLWVPAHISQNPLLLNFTAAVISIVSVAVILFRSPFPMWFRLGLPFTYFLGYQYSIIARGYCLATLGFVLVSLTYKARWQQPWRYVLSLLLLAHSTTHGFLVAAVFASYDLWGWDSEKRAAKRGLLKLAPVFILGMLAVVVQLFPRPADYQFVMNSTKFINFYAISLNNALAEYRWLTAVIVLSSLYAFYRGRVLYHFLAAYLGLGFFFSTQYYRPYHSGFLFLVWMFCVWQCYAVPESEKHVSKKALELGMACLLVVQVYQTALTVSYDYREPYTGLQAAVQDVARRNIPLNQLTLSNFYGMTLNAYLPVNKPGYYMWSSGFKERGKRELFEMPTRFQVTGMQSREDVELLPKLESLGTRVLQVYPGATVWKGKRLEISYFALLENPNAPLRPLQK